jgi:hypothetical protein
MRQSTARPTGGRQYIAFPTGGAGTESELVALAIPE